jgi:hypothetical protein
MQEIKILAVLGQQTKAMKALVVLLPVRANVVAVVIVPHI